MRIVAACVGVLSMSLAQGVFAAWVSVTVSGEVTSVIDDLPVGHELFPVAIGDRYSYSFKYDPSRLWEYNPSTGDYPLEYLRDIQVTVGSGTYRLGELDPNFNPAFAVYDDSLGGNPAVYSDGYRMMFADQGWMELNSTGALITWSLLQHQAAPGGPLSGLDLPLGVIDVEQYLDRSFEFSYTFQRWEHEEGVGGGPGSSWIAGYGLAFDGTVDSVIATPLPASAWLFSSTLLALVASVRRKRLHN